MYQPRPDPRHRPRPAAPTWPALTALALVAALLPLLFWALTAPGVAVLVAGALFTAVSLRRRLSLHRPGGRLRLHLDLPGVAILVTRGSTPATE